MSQNPYKGILLVWSLGEGEGKTTVLKEWSYDLSKVIWIRDDPKPLAFDTKKLGMYYSLEEETRGLKRYEIGEWFVKLLDSVEGNGYQGIVIDTCYYLGECICAMVDKNPTKYRENYSSKSEYKYPQIKGEGHVWHSKVLSRMSEMFQFVGLATHSMPKYDQADIKTGLYIPRARPELMKAASDIWLITPSDNGNYCPTALIIKQSPRSTQTERGERTLTILPKKVQAQDSELSLWDCYHRYYENPISTRETLEDHEKPSLEELAFVSGNMTPDQKRIYDLAIKKREQEIKDAEMLLMQKYNEAKVLVKSLIPTDNKPPISILASKILSQIQEEYSDLTKNDIIEMIGE